MSLLGKEEKRKVGCVFGIWWLAFEMDEMVLRVDDYYDYDGGGVVDGEEMNSIALATLRTGPGCC